MSDAMLLSWLLRSAVVLCAAALAALLLRRASASLRHVVWCAALVSLLMLPFLTRLSPSWQPAAIAPAADPVRTVLTVFANPEPEPVSGGAFLWQLWLTGAILLLLLEAGREWRCARIIRRARSASRQGDGDVLVSGEVNVPVVCGLWRPSILLPAGSRQWSAERRRLVLAHERMHLCRRDPFWLALARLARALWWPQPLAWWAAAQVRKECEHAADDGVLVQGVSPSLYAGQLVEIARAMAGRAAAPQGAIAMTRVSDLERRLRAMLNPNQDRRPAHPRSVAAAALIAACLLIPLSSLRAPALAAGTGIRGVVQDASGARVPGARVIVLLRQESGDRSATPRREFTFTDEVGEFTLSPLPEGGCDVIIEKAGFARLQQSGIAIAANELTAVQFTLNVGRIQERMQVSAPVAAPAPRAAAVPQSEPRSAPPSRITVGGHVQGAMMLKQVRPAYPPECKAAGLEGTVLLEAVIGKDGSVISAQAVNQLVDPRFVDSALEAVRQWQYKPTLLNGQPVEVLTQVEINFTLSR